MIFAFVSLAAWWACSSVASADDGTTADHSDAGTAGEAAPASLAELPLFAGPAPSPAAEAAPVPAPAERGAAEGAEVEVVVAEPTEEVVADPPAQEPVLLPTVVVPLVEAVSPALAPVGDAVHPLLDAVTTPAAPLVQTVVPVVDQLAGPVVAPVVAPLVAVVAPVLEQTATAVAPMVGLAAPLVVPVVRPVVALVAPLLEQVSTAVTAPLVAIVGPALQPLAEASSRSVGLRPSTTAITADPPVGPAISGDPFPGDAPAPPAGAPRTAVRAVHPTTADTGAGALDTPAGGHAAVLSSALSPAASPFDGPSRPAAPAPRNAAMVHAGSDTGQRDQRLVAVLSPAADMPAARLSALSGAAAGSPPARSGGRPPVTPD